MKTVVTTHLAFEQAPARIERAKDRRSAANLVVCGSAMSRQWLWAAPSGRTPAPYAALHAIFCRLRKRCDTNASDSKKQTIFLRFDLTGKGDIPRKLSVVHLYHRVFLGTFAIASVMHCDPVDPDDERSLDPPILSSNELDTTSRSGTCPTVQAAQSCRGISEHPTSAGHGTVYRLATHIKTNLHGNDRQSFVKVNALSGIHGAVVEARHRGTQRCPGRISATQIGMTRWSP